jgi:hypothetical protein
MTKIRAVYHRLIEVPKALDAIADTVLRHRPKARSKPAVQRKRRRTILEKQKDGK